MSGYSEEDDEADREYWAQLTHGGAGDDHEYAEPKTESIDEAEPES